MNHACGRAGGTASENTYWSRWSPSATAQAGVDPISPALATRRLSRFDDLRHAFSNSSHPAQWLQYQSRADRQSDLTPLHTRRSGCRDDGSAQLLWVESGCSLHAPISAVEFCTLFSLCIHSQGMSQYLVGDFRRFTSDLTERGVRAHH